MKRLIIVVLFVAAASSLSAQQNQGGGRNQPQQVVVQARAPSYWEAKLPGGSFVVAHSTIRSVSNQQYVVDGTARVTEVNIDTGGSFKPRFYYLEPVGADVAQNVPGLDTVADQIRTHVQTAADTAGTENPVWSKVVKNYPATTHAGTVEFRLETLQQLGDLYDSVERSWITGKSESFTLEGIKPFTIPKKPQKNGPDPTDPNANGAETN